MDKALQLVIEMNQHTWQRFKDELDDVTPEEINWQPSPRANTLNAILKHLRVEAQWYLASLEHGEQSPYHDTASVQQLAEAVPLDFARNLQDLDELYTRFIAALERTTLIALRQQTVLAQIFPSGASYPAHLLSFRQALHLAMHWGQIRTIRNLYRKMHAEPARFFPDNPTFPA
jgi:DinB superfamily